MNWARRNGWRLAAVAALIPVYLGVEMWEDVGRRNRTVEQVVEASSEITERGISWRMESMSDPATAKSSTGKVLKLPKDTRLVVVHLGHKGNPLVCSVRVRDDRGRLWNGSTPGAEYVWLTARRTCPSADSKDAPKPGQWARIAVPFLVPVDAKGLRVEVKLASAVEEPKRWARLAP